VSGERDPAEDGTYVLCAFYAANQQDAPEMGVFVYPFDQSFVDGCKEDVKSGEYEDLPGVGEMACIFAAEGPDETSDAAGKKGQLWFDVFTAGGGSGRPTAKQQAIALATLVAQRLP
jgi:hypothetical protein